VHSRFPARQGARREWSDLAPASILETLRRSSDDRDPQTASPLVQTRKRPSVIVHLDAPSDLDRIAQANSAIEVLDTVNEVLHLLHHSGTIAQIPPDLRREPFKSASELQEAFPGSPSSNDAIIVLQTLLNAANNKLKELGSR
jgi:hypothetical protein